MTNQEKLAIVNSKIAALSAKQPELSDFSGIACHKDAVDFYFIAGGIFAEHYSEVSKTLSNAKSFLESQIAVEKALALQI